MFKNKYIGKVEVKANVVKGRMLWFLVKGCVNAAMKNKIYTVRVHLNQANRKVVYSNCTCEARKGGRCKHIVALLFQIIKYKQFDLTDIPDHLTSPVHNYYNKGICQEKISLMNLFCVGTFHLKKQFTRKIPREKTKKTTSES